MTEVNPIVSVIVPVYNGGDAIAACIDALLDQVTRVEFEILVVDNGSTDSTPLIMAQYAQRDARIRNLHQTKRGSYAARNIGIGAARGDFLFFLDADCVAEDGWIEAMFAGLSSSEAGAALGWSNGDGKTPLSRTLQAEYEAILARYTDGTTASRLDTRNCAIRKDIVEKVGPFREDFLNYGDAEMGYRILAIPSRVLFVKDAVITHTHIQELDEYIRKQKRIGRNLKSQFGSMSATEVNRLLPYLQNDRLWKMARTRSALKRMFLKPIIALRLRLLASKWRKIEKKQINPNIESMLQLQRIARSARLLGYWQ